MKIIIENTKFPYDLGCRLLKLKHETCPFPELEDIWNDIVPLTFKEIAKLENLEQRRVGIVCLGLERLISEVNPTLLNKKTVDKKTTWINKDGVVETKNFKDTYELYEVSGKYFSEGLEGWRRVEDSHFVKCKDTSTNREYLIWVNLQEVATNNGQDRWSIKKEKVNAIQAIAWTIQTTVKKGNIEKMIRQGDCILIKPKNPNAEMLPTPRHLTEEEYLTLLVAES